MKRMSRISCTLALLLTSLGSVPSANAVGLAGFSTSPATLNGVQLGGMPAWFQDQNGVAVQPCLDVVPCGLAARLPDPARLPVADPGFDPNLAVAFPGNFPEEFFYYAVDVEFLVGTSLATFVVAQEIVFQNALGEPALPADPGAVAAPFQRLRFDYAFLGLNPTTHPGIINAGDPPPEALVGTFKLTTPWGNFEFNLKEALDNARNPTNPTFAKCETVGTNSDTHCEYTRDIFSLPLAVPPDFAPALANGVYPFGGPAMSTFLQDPAAAPGFLGTPVGALSFTGAPAGRPNLFAVTDPMGNTASNTKIRVIFGKKFGMEVSPLPHDFGALPVTTPATTSPAQTITVTNPDAANAMTLGTLALAGANAADFTITADTCSGQPLAATAKCTFDVAFAPKPILAPATEAALRTAIVNIPITGAFAGVADAPTGRAVLSGTALFTMSASAGANGTISPAGAAIIVNAGATQNFTITPNAKFQVKDITVNGTPATFTKAANPSDPVTFTSPAITATGTTINATFMPSGDLDGDGILGVNDALKALKILVGLPPAPTAVDLVAMKVTPLDAAGRPNGTGAPDLNDVVLILRRVLGVVTW